MSIHLDTMRGLFLLAVLFLSGCLAQATPTPIEVQQYPATWTPAPTPTNTPPGPTATLVIQRTPGALPTRDPNARVLPNAPRTGIGIWMSVNAETPPVLDSLSARANVIVTDGSGNVPRSANTFVLFAPEAGTFDAKTSLASEYAGVVIAPLSSEQAQGMRDALKPRVLLARLPVTGTATYQNLSNNLDGVLVENFLTDANTPLSKFANEVEWKRDVEFVATVTRNPNHVVLVQTQVGEDKGDASATVEQWHSYALASYLLGINNAHAFFGFASANAPQAADSPLLNLELGSPTGGTIKQNGVYQRRFLHGLVLVNPTEDTHAFTLPRNHVDANGARVNVVNMAPHTGMLLLNTE